MIAFRKKSLSLMKSYIMYLLTSLFLVHANAQETTVFRNGEDGYACYRIPAIVKALNGELLAFCEARKDDCKDHGDVRIVMKRSGDNGKTWGPLEFAAGSGGYQAGNPAPVFDLLDRRYRKGRLFLFYNTGTNASEYEVRQGKAIREAWYKTSNDNGRTWSDPVNITSSVSRPNMPQLNSGYAFREDWRSLANTPGHALQIRRGKYKGRLFIAANHSAGAPQNDFSDYKAHGYYSDDHGRTWTLTPPVEYPGSNESTAAELSSGGVLMNIRDQSGRSKYRLLAYSRKAGDRWDTVYTEKQLPDPVCEGSMINYTTKNGQELLLFSNLDHLAERKNLTLYASQDDGRTWRIVAVICPGSAAYSDLVIQADDGIGVLYEKDGYTRIVYQSIPPLTH